LSPGRRTNRKNFRSCQRTSVFLLFSFIESMKKVRLYLASFQWSAGGSQAGAADLVQPLRQRAWGCASWRNFGGIFLCGAVQRCEKSQWLFVKIAGKTALDSGFRGFSVTWVDGGLEMAGLSRIQQDDGCRASPRTRRLFSATSAILGFPLEKSTPRPLKTAAECAEIQIPFF
jgi:hypothetical protein